MNTKREKREKKRKEKQKRRKGGTTKLIKEIRIDEEGKQTNKQKNNHLQIFAE